jgi:hypothetical protein
MSEHRGVVLINTPFLEIKLNTALLPFLQEFVRLSTQFMESSHLEISRITAQISEPLIHSETARRHDLDITSDEYSQLELLAQSNFSSWRLWFHTHHLGSLWKEMISFQLQTIGGSHPLLIRFDGCSPELYLLLSQLLERCSVLWEARVVTVADPSHTLSHFFKIIDVRHYTWLAELERLYYGDCYERYAPSVQRTREEQKAREARYGPDRGSEADLAEQPGPAPTPQPVMEPDAAPESTRPSQTRRA